MEPTAPDSSKATNKLPDPISLALKYAIYFPKFPYRGQPIHAWLAINGILHDILSYPELKPPIDQYTDPIDLQRLETGMLGMLIKEEPQYELLGLFCLDIPGFETAWDTLGGITQFKILVHWKAILEAASTYQDDELLSPENLQVMTLQSYLDAEFSRRSAALSVEETAALRAGVRLALDVIAGKTPESPGYQLIPLGDDYGQRPDLHAHLDELYTPIITTLEPAQ